MAKAGYSGTFELAPNVQTIKFGGKYINLSAIARSQGFDLSYMSRLMSGKRRLTLANSRKIAALLGMTLDDFDDAYQERMKEVKKSNQQVYEDHERRISEENRKDLATLMRGKIPIPRLPGTRLPSEK